MGIAPIGAGDQRRSSAQLRGESFQINSLLNSRL
jgi:hypothetical protein